MDLQLTHPAGAWHGYAREDVFFVTDASQREYGRGVLVYQLLPHLYPDRPVNIYFDLTAEPAAQYMLLGAMMARARQLRDRDPSLRARMYTCISPDDALNRSFYERGAFRMEDTERMLILHPQSLDGRTPMGCAVALTPLNTPQEQQAFLSRLQAHDITHISMDYLSELLRTQHVCAIGLIYQDIIAGEALLAGMGDSSELIAIYIRPEFRRKGMGTSLLNHCMALLHREGVERFTARFLSASAPQMGLARAFQAEEAGVVAVFPSVEM